MWHRSGPRANNALLHGASAGAAPPLARGDLTSPALIARSDVYRAAALQRSTQRPSQIGTAMQSLPNLIETARRAASARRPAVLLAHPRARFDRARAALLSCAAVLSAGLAVSGCEDEEDPFGVGSNYAEAGANGGIPGGNGGVITTPDGGALVPFDAGAPPLGSDASITPIVDAGAGSLGGGPDAASGAGGVIIPTGDAGDAGSADAASGGDASTTPPHADLGKGDGSDVLMIGDSWMSLGSANSGIQGGILKASGQPYRANGIGGTTLLGEGVLDAIFASIPVQYEQAIQADPDVKTVIMTAGGNDILQTGLQDDCKMMGDACGAQVTRVLDALSKLWAEMAGDGVQDIVYILYATPEGTSVDFMLPSGDGAKKRCAAVPAPTRCHIVETLATVMGDIPDDIHPSQVASDRIGKVVVDLMAAQGMRR
jgi:hypothetical protein